MKFDNRWEYASLGVETSSPRDLNGLLANR